MGRRYKGVDMKRLMMAVCLAATSLSMAGCATLGTAGQVADVAAAPAIAVAEAIFAGELQKATADLEAAIAAGTAPSAADAVALSNKAATSYGRLGIARAVFDATLGMRAPPETLHLVSEVRGETDAAYDALQLTLARLIAPPI